MLDLFYSLVSARDGHFRLESGHHSALWLDLDSLFADPARVRPLITALADLIRGHAPEVVCGPLVGGAFLAQAVAMELGTEFAFTERHLPADANGLYRARYVLPSAYAERVQGRRVAVVDDVMSAGSAVVSTCDELRSRGANVVAAGALLVLGTRGAELLAGRTIALEAVGRRQYELWLPERCDLCARGVTLSDTHTLL